MLPVSGSGWIALERDRKVIGFHRKASEQQFLNIRDLPAKIRRLPDGTLLPFSVCVSTVFLRKPIHTS